VDGGTSITEVNERLSLALPEQDFETVGGFVFGELGRLPAKGDTVVLDGFGALRVEATRKRRITLVRYIPARRAGDAAPADAAAAPQTGDR
jgi:putative hemolysin